MKYWVINGLLIALLEVLAAGKVIAQTVPDGARGAGNLLNYPAGTQVYPNGVIQTPRGENLPPAAIIPHGDGSTTFYYSNGTQITIERNAANPLGTPLRPGSLNGGLNRNSLIQHTSPAPLDIFENKK
ncbi:MAG: hypothetical protein HY785_25875 [Oscillatoriophycideae cyanobacterium NC_groundwater_1537_Pr4_S-0.65um_50_18]|nr:hypothetical protein [Oscillatoriophycideae cyanobacterium NC_groundwater_1537_Pr4_S-0.65um_50_18]